MALISSYSGKDIVADIKPSICRHVDMCSNALHVVPARAIHHTTMKAVSECANYHVSRCPFSIRRYAWSMPQLMAMAQIVDIDLEDAIDAAHEAITHLLKRHGLICRRGRLITLPLHLCAHLDLPMAASALACRRFSSMKYASLGCSL